jgi:hypothetical protein
MPATQIVASLKAMAWEMVCGGNKHANELKKKSIAVATYALTTLLRFSFVGVAHEPVSPAVPTKR